MKKQQRSSEREHYATMLIAMAQWCVGVGPADFATAIARDEVEQVILSIGVVSPWLDSVDEALRSRRTVDREQAALAARDRSEHGQ